MRSAARWLQIRPGEARLVALTAGMFAAVQAGQGLGANTADALLFRRFGVDSLPVLFILLGAATLVTTLAYGAALGRFESRRLSTMLLAGAAAVLLVGRAAVAFDTADLYPALWLAISLTAALLGTLVWNVAGDLCDARQAKRLFPLFASAGILGSVVGNLVTGLLAQALRTENLLVIDGGLLVAAAGLVAALPQKKSPRATDGVSMGEQLRVGHDYVWKSPLMRLTALSGILFSILYFSVSYPFSRAVASAFPQEAALAGFLGGFSGAVTAVTFVVSTVLASRVYARVGVVNSVLLLPALYAVGFGVWMARFDLASAAAVRFGQMVLLGGLAGTAYNALFNVVPAEKRAQVRAYQAGVPAQVGVVLSGALLWLGQRGLEERSVFIAGLMVAGACGYAVFLTRGAYGRSLVEALRTGMVDVFAGPTRDLRVLGADAQARRSAETALADPRPAARRIAAEVLGRMATADSIPALEASLRDAEPDVRRASIQALGQIPGAATSPAIRQRLQDTDPLVRLEALSLLGQQQGVPTSVFEDPLGDPDARVSAAAAAALLRRQPDERAEAVLTRLWNSPHPADRVASLQAGAWMTEAAALPRLERALSSGSRAERLASLDALARRKEEGSRRLLLETIAGSEPAMGRAAAVAYQTSSHPSQAVADLLPSASGDVQDAALAALHGHGDEVRKTLLEWAIAEVPRAREHRDLSSALAPVDGAERRESVEFLHDLLRREEERIERRILAALALVGGVPAMGTVARGLRSTDPDLRSQALEALDTIGEKRVTRALLPLLEASPDTGQPIDTASLLRRLSEHPRPWVRALALHARAEAMELERSEWARRVKQDPDPALAQLLVRWPSADGRKAEERGSRMDTSATLTTLERVLFLRQVPLFASLEPEDLQQIAEWCVERRYEDGDALVREGEIGDEMLVVVEGSGRVVKISEGTERVLRRFQTGSHIGELAILREQPRSASAIAEGGPVRVLALSGKALTSILNDRPAVSLAMLTSLAERLSTLA